MWFRVDNRPFKNALRNIVKRWSLMFKQHLIDHVTNSLNDLNDFIKVSDNNFLIVCFNFKQRVKSGLSVTVEEGDYDGLVDVVMNLLAVKDRQPTTDNMFEPLKQTIELLKTYNQEMPDEIHQLLEVQKWHCNKIYHYNKLGTT